MAVDTEVVVIGAGLAGLACAARLHEAGVDVLVVEASDGPGGRVRTDVVDGFLLDRGFQVLLPGYPALPRWFDLEALDLQPFAPGVAVRVGGRTRRLVDPFQNPVSGLVGSFGAITSGVLTPADAIRFVAWRRSILRASGPEVAATEQVPIARRLDERGFSRRMVERFFRPFLGGVFFDRDLETSSRVVELVLRSFFRSGAALPAAGMGSLSAQLAARLPANAMATSSPVRQLEVADGQVRAVLDTGAVIARKVVVATDGPSAMRLLSEGTGINARQDLVHSPVSPPVTPPGKGSTTLWYAAAKSPMHRAELLLAGDADGPVNNLAVVSDVAPTYAPPGRALVAASVIGVPAISDDDLDRQARKQLTGWFGRQVGDWRLVRSDRIPWAQPRQTIDDVETLARATRVADRVWICGDHRDTGSIQGSLVSGRRAADDLLAAAG